MASSNEVSIGFQLKNPTIDINPSLVGTSPSFQKFIEDGLAKLEREGGDNKRTNPIVQIRTTPNAKDHPADFYLSKLNSLKVSFFFEFLSSRLYFSWEPRGQL